MRISRIVLLVLVFVAFGCETKPIEPSANEASAAALWTLALADHGETHKPIKLPIAGTSDSSPQGVQKDTAGYCFFEESKAAVELSSESAVLLVPGLQCFENAESVGPAIMGAYFFQKRDGKWFKAKQAPVFRKLSAANVYPTLKLAVLADGTNVVGVEHGVCGGSCGPESQRETWLHLIKIELGALTPLTAGANAIQIGSEYDPESCSEIATIPVGGKLKSQCAFPAGPGHCQYIVQGAWTFSRAVKSPGDLVVTYSGKRLGASAVIDDGSAAAPTASAETPLDEQECEFKIEPIKGQQIYRLKDGHYIPHRGENLVDKYLRGER